MKIDKHKVVSLTYMAEVEGEIVDRATESQPLEYIQGCHMLLPVFEDEVEGKEAGDAFAFSAAPADAYGEYNPASCFDIPKDSFVVNGVLREDLLVVGRLVPMFNAEGQVCHARIVDIKEDKVTVDFNHPMAGKTINFTGTVLGVREATEKELSEGLHGEFLPPEHHCHCHGGCHHGEGGCGHGEGEGHCGGHEGGCCHGEGEGNCGGEGCGCN